MLEDTWEERYWAARDLAYRLFAPEDTGSDTLRTLDEAEAFFKDHPAKTPNDKLYHDGIRYRPTEEGLN